MQITLPDNLKPLLEKGAVTAGVSVDAFVLRALLSSNRGLFASFDELDEVDANREQALIEGFQSGQFIPITPGFWRGRRRVLQGRIAVQSKVS
jgi:hypothetical protein